MANQHTINIRGAIASIIGKKMARDRLRADYHKHFDRIYSFLRYDSSWRERNIPVPNNESGFIIGSVVSALKGLSPAPATLLLAGENKAAKPVYANIVGIAPSAITIAGLDDTSDIQWNFEQNPPAIGQFDAVVSHAIIEHLIDPYKHTKDLFSLVAPGGSAIIYTVMPNIQYHSHPVDCVRFFPDWFVEVSKRTNMTITDLCISEDHIIVTFKK